MQASVTYNQTARDVKRKARNLRTKKIKRYKRMEAKSCKA